MTPSAQVSFGRDVSPRPYAGESHGMIRIMGLGLGEFKGVACLYDPGKIEDMTAGLTSARILPLEPPKPPKGVCRAAVEPRNG